MKKEHKKMQVIIEEIEYYSKERDKEYSTKKEEYKKYHEILLENGVQAFGDFGIPQFVKNRLCQKIESSFQMVKYQIYNEVIGFIFLEELAAENLKYIHFKDISKLMDEKTVIIVPNPMENIEYMTFRHLEELFLDGKDNIKMIAFSKIRNVDEYIILKEMIVEMIPAIAKIGISIDTDSVLEYIEGYIDCDFMIFDLDELIKEYEICATSEITDFIENMIKDVHQYLRIKKKEHYIKYKDINQIEVLKKIKLKGFPDIICIKK